MSKLCVSLLLSVLSLSGCALPTAADSEPTKQDADPVSLGAADAAAVLALVNYPGTTSEILDGEVGLDARAAEGIVAHRNGPDGVAPSADDDPFDTIEELDAIAYVGDSAFSKLGAWAALHPAPAGETVEGVTFTGWQAEAVVWTVNHGSPAVLQSAGLTVTAASNLSAAAPVANLSAVGAVAQVGPATLTKLREAAAAWWPDMQQGSVQTGMAGSYDGVVFDAATAEVAFEIASEAGYQQLTTDGKLWSTGALAIVSARPFSSLAAVALVSGVGSATMQALHDYAASGKWTGPTEPTVCSMTSAPKSVASVSQFATQLTAFDHHDQMYEYTLGAYAVPACIDPNDPKTLESLRSLLIQSSGWDYIVKDFPQVLEYGPLVAGPSALSGLLDNALQAMDDQRAERVADGDAGAQSEYEELAASKATLAAELDLHPGKTWSLKIRVDASECSQVATLFVDVAAGTVIVMHRPAQC